MVKQAKQLDDAFEDVLKDIFYAEKKILARSLRWRKPRSRPT
jgi:ferritin-like metal-binding protein YciE